MNFDFSDDQKMVRDEAHKFLADRCPPQAARRILDGQALFDSDLWQAIGGLGWTGTAIPEAYGGLGLGYLELCVIAQELGRVLAPIPFASSVYLATEALLLGGSEMQKRHWLPRLAAGDAIGTFALAETAQAPTPGRIRTRFEDGRLTGVKLPVPDGNIADFAVVAARTGAAEGDAISLVLVSLDQPGVSRVSVETVDPTRDHARITFAAAPAELLGAADAGWALSLRVLDRAAVLMAFEQVGGTEAALAMARDYALQRYAFARPIGSFQAIKHKLADMFVGLELARSNAYYGAWALSSDAAELPLAAAGARLAAIEAYEYAATENIQVHGGNGYTWEFDCHLHYRRAKHLALTLGSARRWSERLVGQFEALHPT